MTPGMDHAVERLVRNPVLHRAEHWPISDPALDPPGLYAWFVDPDGASELSVSLGCRIAAGLIYIGQTGATKWPSGKRCDTVLRDRAAEATFMGRSAGRPSAGHSTPHCSPPQPPGPKRRGSRAG